MGVYFVFLLSRAAFAGVLDELRGVEIGFASAETDDVHAEASGIPLLSGYIFVLGR